MGLLAVWKVLEEMIVEFRCRGITVPAEVMNRMRSAKTLIKVLEMDFERKEIGQKIDEHLLSVQSYLVPEGQKQFGEAYAEEWLQRLNEAGRGTPKRKEKKANFVFGIPKGQKWIRIKTSSEMLVEKLKSLADKLNLSYEIQKNNFLLVYGEEKIIKSFLKKLTAKNKPKS